MSEESGGISIGIPLFLQTALLVMHYGFSISMPLWVVWFPFLVIGGILGIVLLVFIIVGFIGAIMDFFNYSL